MVTDMVRRIGKREPRTFASSPARTRPPFRARWRGPIQADRQLTTHRARIRAQLEKASLRLCRHSRILLDELHKECISWTKTADAVLENLAAYCTRINDSTH
jgi:hypothetical protein